MDYVLAFQRLTLKSISHLTVLLVTDLLEAVFVLFYISLLDCFKPFLSSSQEQHEDSEGGFTTLFFFY